jgi:hypothetical protein
MVERHGDSVLVVGSRDGRVSLRAGDTLGYAGGEVWLVPRPEQYRDSIRGVLALAHLPQEMLRYSDEPIEYRRGRPSREAVRVLGDSKNERRWEPAFYSDGMKDAVDSVDIVTGGEAVIVKADHAGKNDLNYIWRVERIIVRTTADKSKVAAWLEEELTPEGQQRRAERVAARQSVMDVVVQAKYGPALNVMLAAGFLTDTGHYINSLHARTDNGDREWWNVNVTPTDTGVSVTSNSEIRRGDWPALLHGVYLSLVDNISQHGKYYNGSSGQDVAKVFTEFPEPVLWDGDKLVWQPEESGE